MLDEDEWAQLAEPLGCLAGDIKRIRQDRGVSLREATKLAGAEVLRRFLELTGYEETNVNAVWHHRRLLFGPPCHACGKPLRTPEAKHCAECGGWRQGAI